MAVGKYVHISSFLSLSRECKLIIFSFSILLNFLVKSHSIGDGACLFNLGNITGNIEAGSCIGKDACSENGLGTAENTVSIGAGSW